MNRYIGLVLLVFLASCKSKAVLAEAGAGKKEESAKIIQGHYANKKDFSTIYVKAAAHYEDAKQSQNVSAEIKIKKDEIILVSIRFLGITMAKAMITPTEVKYYEKINGKYFEGDYATLSKWLGTDLDFQKVQNILIGLALDDLKKDNYTASVEDTYHKLSATDGNTTKDYFFEGAKFLLKREKIAQTKQQRSVQIAYPNYTDYTEMTLPTSLLIEAFDKNEKTNISIDYNSATFNEAMTFPYSVPEGYERIYIN
jgi:hypothetical protein